MKRILFIVNQISGGVETVLTAILRHLDPKKYEIGIVEIIHDGSQKQIDYDNNVKIYPYYTLADAPDRKTRMYYVYHEWDKVIEEYIPQDYDLYVSFNYLKPSFLLPQKKKCIAWIHGDVYNLAAENKIEEKILQNQAFYKANKIVAVSEVTAQSIMDLFPEHKNKVCILYNGINMDEVREKALIPTNVAMEHPAVLAIGRLDENKNPLRMLRVFERVCREVPKAHLYYLGRGKLEEDVKALSRELGLEDRVHLLGYYDNPYPIIAQCDVVGMFSLSEGFPMALLESVTLNKPFVATHVGGAKALANEGKCGQVVNSDEEGAAALIKFIFKDKAIHADDCREFVKRFEIKSYIKQVEALFDDVLADKCEYM